MGVVMVMNETEAVAMLSALEAVLDRPAHEVFGVEPSDDLIGICVAYAAAAARYNPSRFAGMAPEITQRVVFDSAKLRTIFQQHVAGVQRRLRDRRNAEGRLHSGRR